MAADRARARHLPRRNPGGSGTAPNCTAQCVSTPEPAKSEKFAAFFDFREQGAGQERAARCGSRVGHSAAFRAGAVWQRRLAGNNRGIRSADSRDPSPRSCSARSPRCLICIADPVVSRRDTLANCPPGNSASAGASGNAPALPTMAATAACLRGAGTSVAAPHCCYRALVRRGRRGSSAPRRRRDLDFR